MARAGVLALIEKRGGGALVGLGTVAASDDSSVSARPPPSREACGAFARGFVFLIALKIACRGGAYARPFVAAAGQGLHHE